MQPIPTTGAKLSPKSVELHIVFLCYQLTLSTVTSCVLYVFNVEPCRSITNGERHSSLQIVPRLHEFSGIILSSQRAARCLSTALSETGTAMPEKLPVCAVGSKSAAHLAGLPCEILGHGTRNAAELCDIIISKFVGVERPFLFLRGDKSLDIIPERLTSAEIPLQSLEVYTSSQIQPKDVVLGLHKLDLPRSPHNFLLCCSPSAAEAVKAIIEHLLPPIDTLRVIAIGETTAKVLVDSGIVVCQTLAAPTPAALIDAIHGDIGKVR